MIHIQHLTKSFGKKEVLKDIELSLDKGMVYGIVGINGAGKTTLFNCVAGLEEYAGKIDSDINDLKNCTGILHTDPYFFDMLTAREYLTLICHARHLQLPDFNQKNIFNLPLDEYASLYSTGMKKKLALTGILIQQNEFYILDEPFNGVDIQSNIVITEIIHKLKSLDRTVLISSHIFSTLSKVCDIIFVLENNRIMKEVNRGNFDQLEADIIESTVGKDIDLLMQ